MYKNILKGLIITILAASCQHSSQQVITGLVSDSAMVVSAHPLASQVGVDVLKQGGNAIDAAVATGFALAVCYPNAGNLGGGGFMVIRFANGESITLDYRETAPLAATRTMYLDSAENVVDELSLYHALAAGVPGSVHGLLTAHEKYGKLALAKLIDPAIDLATNGFAITKNQASDLNNLRTEFIRLNSLPTAFTKQKQWKAGDLLVQSELGKTLQRIKDKGIDGFYKGKTANLIVDFMQQSGGLITHEDLMSYKSVW